MIKLNEVNYTANQHIILQNINLDIPMGKIFTIIGASGAGKSSLLRCINLLNRPTKGTIHFDQQEISDLPEQQLQDVRRQMGMIFQHFNLLSSQTVFDNIALPLKLAKQAKEKIKERVTELLALINLSDKANHYPHELSGGQKQRVAIARALALSPKVLLCDEPTSALDPESAQLVLALLKKINQELNITIILISHQMDVIKSIADFVAVIDQGKIVEIAPVLDIFTQPKTAISKKLTQQNLHLVLPENIQQKLKSTKNNCTIPLIKMTFIGQTAEQSLLAHLMQKFNVADNILLADIEMIHQKTLGFTVCELEGKEADINQALQFMRERGILIEVLGYVA